MSMLKMWKSSDFLLKYFLAHFKDNPAVYLNVSIDRVYNELSKVLSFNRFPLAPPHFYCIKVSI